MTTAPTSEIGSALLRKKPLMPRGFGSADPHWHLLDDPEYIPDLKFPKSVDVYDKMRSDAQVHGLWMGMTLPIRRYRWMINPNGARDQVVEELATDLALPIRGAEPGPKPRSKRRFNHDDHLYHALLGLIYGFMWFEQYGEILGERWRLRKLGPRMPHSISRVLVADDGGPVGIKQKGSDELLPINRLVGYVWQREGANWYGRSMLRPMYKHWFIKDKLVRVDLVKHERNGMGVPTGKETNPDVTPAQRQEMHRLLTQWRAGQNSAATVPYGFEPSLLGVTGNLPDTLASIRYHDEAMARSMLMMFMQLGQTETGSRALGDSFIDFFSLAQETVAHWYTQVTNEHVIEDWVDWNYGEDEPAPLITFERDFDRSYSVADLVTLIDKGAITVDPELEQHLREQGNLPEKAQEDAPSGRPYEYDLQYGILLVDERRQQLGLDPLPNGEGQRIATPTPAGEPAVTPPESGESVPGAAQTARKPRAQGNRRVRRLRTAKAPDGRLPERTLRRELYEHEVLSQANFRTIDEAWQSALDELLEVWSDVKAEQIDELAARVAETDSLEELAAVTIEATGSDIILERLVEVMEQGVESAAEEAEEQGVQPVIPDMDAIVEDLEGRADAIAVMLSRSIAEAAGRRAVALTGGSLSPEQVADEVRSYLSGLSNTYLEDQFGGALTQAQNTGRAAAMDANDPAKVYGSELLDANTCENCVGIDGTEYDTVAAARADYPTGGYKDCKGGPRCRGLLVAVYDEEPEEEDDA